MNDRKIERSYERGFCQWQILANSIKLFFHTDVRKNIHRHCPKASKPFLLLRLELSHYRKIGGAGTFS